MKRVRCQSEDGEVRCRLKDEEVGWRLSSMEVHRRRSPNVGGGDSQKPLDLPRR